MSVLQNFFLMDEVKVIKGFGKDLFSRRFSKGFQVATLRTLRLHGITDPKLKMK